MQTNPKINLNKSDAALEELAALMVQQQGIHFATHQEAEKHLKGTTVQLRELLQQSSATFVEGLKHLSSCDHHPVADIAKKLEAVPGIAVVRLTDQDVVRHPLVASMLGVL